MPGERPRWGLLNGCARHGSPRWRRLLAARGIARGVQPSGPPAHCRARPWLWDRVVGHAHLRGWICIALCATSARRASSSTARLLCRAHAVVATTSHCRCAPSRWDPRREHACSAISDQAAPAHSRSVQMPCGSAATTVAKGRTRIDPEGDEPRSVAARRRTPLAALTRARLPHRPDGGVITICGPRMRGLPTCTTPGKHGACLDGAARPAAAVPRLPQARARVAKLRVWTRAFPFRRSSWPRAST